MTAETGWPTAYRALRQQHFQRDAYALMPIRWEDREFIRQWRNAQLDILRQQAPLAVADQDRYFSAVVRPLFEAEQPGQVLFSFLKDNELIGYGGLVHIDWAARRAEVSFLLETERNRHLPTFKSDFSAYLHLLRDAAFAGLSLQKINTEAYDVRPYLTEVLEQTGFQFEARLRHHVSVGGQLVDTLFHSCFRPTGPRPVTVLVTSIARKVPLLQAVRQAAYQLHPDSRIIGADANPDCIGRHFTDDFWLMPPTTDEHLPAIVAYCRAQGISHIIPTRDGELPFWSRHRTDLAKQNVHVMVSAPASLERCMDKLQFAEFGLAAGLPMIPASLHLNDLPGDAFVVKERRGAGSQSLGLNLLREQAATHAQGLTTPVFQPYVAGREISIDAYVTAQGVVHGLLLRTRDIVINGESQLTTTFHDAALAARLASIIARLELYGHVVLQAILDEQQQLHLIECNARFGGASTLAVAQGLDSFYWFLLETTGIDLADHPFQPVPKQLQQVRYAKDLVKPVLDK